MATSHPLDGQVAVVTGGGRGLGRGMAQALAQAGAAVGIIGRNQANLDESAEHIRQSGGRALALAADVTDQQAVERAAEQVTREFGRIDVLVNNAAVVGTPGPFWEGDADDWWQVFDINLRGPYLCSRAVMPGMIGQNRGCIINVASGAATGPLPYLSQYVVSKAALARLTECIALDGQPHGVTAFAIDPGNVFTDMSNYLIHSEPGRKYMSWFGNFMLSGSDDPPTLSANLVVLLTSGKLDSLSGRFIQVSDNADRLAAQADRIQADDLYALRMKVLPSTD